jgi:cytochrome P450
MQYISYCSSVVQAITHVLLDLAAHPEYQEPLREEVESVLQEFGGWSKQALTKMKKTNSVLRESQRMNGAVNGRITTLFIRSRLILIFDC